MSNKSICKICGQDYQIYGHDGICDDCSVDFLVRIEEITAKFRNEVTELAEDWIKGKLKEQMICKCGSKNLLKHSTRNWWKCLDCGYLFDLNSSHLKENKKCL